MKRLRQLAAIGTAAGAIFGILLAWEISADAQAQGESPKTADPTAATITVDPANRAVSSNASYAPGPLTADSGPDAVVTHFLEASRRGNTEEANKLLTETARKKTEEAGMSITPPGSPRTQFGLLSIDKSK